MHIKEHEKTKKETVGKLELETNDLKKELHQRKKYLIQLQQMIHANNNTDVYNKVGSNSLSFWLI